MVIWRDDGAGSERAVVKGGGCDGAGEGVK